MGNLCEYICHINEKTIAIRVADEILIINIIDNKLIEKIKLKDYDKIMNIIFSDNNFYYSFTNESNTNKFMICSIAK